MKVLVIKKLAAQGFMLALFLSFLRAAPGRAEEFIDRPIRDKWAVVIGISKFVKPELDLKYADKDAASFSDYLVSKGNFARDHVKLLRNENASRRQILSVLGSSWLSRVAGPDDLVVIYISSHGSPAELDVEGVNYLLASDSDPDDLYSSGIDMQALARMIKAKVHSDRVVIFLDTCYSGAGTAGGKGLVRKANADVDKIAQSSGQIVISSSLPNQVSWESASRPNSVFTQCLIDGLLAKGDNTTLGDAFSYLKEKVQSTVLQERGELQNPVMRSPWSKNNLVLAARPVSPQVALNEDVEPATESRKAAYTRGASANPAQVSASPAQASGSSAAESGNAKLSERVVMLPFEEGSESGLDLPDYDGLAKLLEELVRLRLSNTLGDKLMSPYDVGAALGKTNLSGIWTAESRVALGRACKAKYIVRVAISDEHFMPDGSLKFAVSVWVANGETGDYIWSGGNKAASAVCQGDSTARLNYLKTEVLPSFAKYVSRAITAAIVPK